MDSEAKPPDAERAIVVVAPRLVLSVMAERSPAGEDEIHLHPAGQGFWVARMVQRLGVPARLCAALGGETGSALRALVADTGIELKTVEAAWTSPAYIHDRREGNARREMAASPDHGLERHTGDDLYGLALTEGLECGTVLLTGVREGSPLVTDFYRRLAMDLRRNGAAVSADLSGPPLRAALEGALDLAHLNSREIVDTGFAEGSDIEALRRGMEAVAAAGARDVLLTRADDPALALLDGELYEAIVPHFQPIDITGPGDSAFAAAAAMQFRGAAPEDVLRLATAAGSLNVTRRGLGSGTRAEIERLAEQIEVRRV